MYRNRPPFVPQVSCTDMDPTPIIRNNESDTARHYLIIPLSSRQWLVKPLL